MLHYGGSIEPEDQQLAEFLRRHKDRIAKKAAKAATLTLPIGGAGARRQLRNTFREHLDELARLLETYGDEAPRIFGEKLRAHAMQRRADGLTVRESIDEEGHLLEATVQEWGARRKDFPHAILRPLISAFTESAAHIADVWVNFQRAESAGFQEAALLSTIVHHLDEAIIVVEASGTISYATPNLEEILGIPPRVLVGLKSEEMLKILDDMHFEKSNGEAFTLEELPAFQALSRRRPVMVDGARLQRSSGETAVLELYAAPVFDEEEELRGAIATIRDRSERAHQVARLEQAYQELREMQTRLLSRSRLEAVGELAGSAAHALNNQFQVLSGRSHRLLEIPEAKNEAESIAQSVNAISELVGRLQEFAEVRTAGEPRPSDLPRAIDTALSLTRTQFSPGSSTTIDARVESVPEVMAEEELLVEFITTLLLGARESMPKAGTVRLRARRQFRKILVSIHAPSDSKFTSPEQLFEPLEGGAQGTGLSLSIARQALRRWGGELKASQENNELCFQMELAPARQRDISAAQAEDFIQKQQGKEAHEKATQKLDTPISRVLVVDDDRDNAEVLSEFLIAAGATTKSAGTVKQALEVAEELHPQAALVDLLLPDGSGWDVAKELRERFPGIRIAVVSGLSAKDAPEAAKVGAVFRKPVEPPRVLSFLGMDG